MSEGMEGAPAASGAKKAVHVKWQGKTIALGTFPCAEADEKCARAKALTRAWRSSMRPKPTREWVINELERLGIRVVSGGGRANKRGEDDAAAAAASGYHPGMMQSMQQMNGAMNPGMNGQMAMQQQMGMMGGGQWNAQQQQQQESENLKMGRRSSSLGVSLLTNNDASKNNMYGGGLGNGMGMGNGTNVDPSGKPFRELVGGGAAAAYNAYRDDFYQQQRSEQQKAGGGGANTASPNLNGMGTGMAPNPNDHYQMLKLHHMNLLNEIQETTLMMNIYQQQHLQQQQQLLQQQQQNMTSIGDANKAMNNLSALQQPGGLSGLQQQQQLPMQQPEHDQLLGQQQALQQQMLGANGMSSSAASKATTDTSQTSALNVQSIPSAQTPSQSTPETQAQPPPSDRSENDPGISKGTSSSFTSDQLAENKVKRDRDDNVLGNEANKRQKLNSEGVVSFGV